MLLVIVHGKRTGEQCQEVVDEVKKRTNGRTNLLITSDKHAPYKTAIEKAYAVETQKPDSSAQRQMPKDLCYATVRKTRNGGRVIDIVKTLIFGTVSILLMLLLQSIVSNTINTSFV